MADIVINVDFEKLAKGMEYAGKAFERGVEKGKREFADRLRLKLLEKLGEYGLGDSSFVSQIVMEDLGSGIRLTVASDHVLYVEFGTGIVGSEHPHKHGWEYDINNHGNDGWWYSKNGSYYWTKGQPARPFMYETWLWGTRSATQIIRKNIRNELKKVNGKL